MKIRDTFRSAVRTFLRWVETDSGEYNSSMPIPTISNGKRWPSSNFEDNNQGLNFTVYSATGGKIIRVQSYDPKLDRSNSALYIVTDRENLGEELAQIITMENLSR